MRGKRQGDLVYPMLFMLAPDVLQSAIKDAFGRNLLKALLPSDMCQYCHVVQYTNETVVIPLAQVIHLLIMKNSLNQYASSVGLYINDSNSSMIPINISKESISVVARSLICSVVKNVIYISRSTSWDC
jgi:hypothetical protein